MSDFTTATEQDEEWSNDLPFEPRTSGPHVAVLLALLAEGIALVVTGAWIPIVGWGSGRIGMVRSQQINSTVPVEASTVFLGPLST